MSRKTPKKSPNAFQARNWSLLIIAGALIAMAVWLTVCAVMAFSEVPIASIMVGLFGVLLIFGCLRAIAENSWKNALIDIIEPFWWG